MPAITVEILSKPTVNYRVQRSDHRNNCYTSNCLRQVIMLFYLVIIPILFKKMN